MWNQCTDVLPLEQKCSKHWSPLIPLIPQQTWLLRALTCLAPRKLSTYLGIARDSSSLSYLTWSRCVRSLQLLYWNLPPPPQTASPQTTKAEAVWQRTANVTNSPRTRALLLASLLNMSCDCWTLLVCVKISPSQIAHIMDRDLQMEKWLSLLMAAILGRPLLQPVSPQSHGWAH